MWAWVGVCVGVDLRVCGSVCRGVRASRLGSGRAVPRVYSLTSTTAATRPPAGRKRGQRRHRERGEAHADNGDRDYNNYGVNDNHHNNNCNGNKMMLMIIIIMITITIKMMIKAAIKVLCFGFRVQY